MIPGSWYIIPLPSIREVRGRTSILLEVSVHVRIFGVKAGNFRNLDILFIGFELGIYNVRAIPGTLRELAGWLAISPNVTIYMYKSNYIYVTICVQVVLYGSGKNGFDDLNCHLTQIWLTTI